MNLTIAGGTHLLIRWRKRIASIDTPDNLDVVFIEGRDGDTPIVERVRNWICCPLLLAVVVAWELFGRVMSSVMVSDMTIAQRLAEDHDAPVVKVDKTVHSIISEHWYVWGCANWTLLAFPLLVLLYLPADPIARYVAMAIVGFSGLGLFSAFVAGTVNDRNITILHKITRIAEENGFENGCMVTGSAHESGLRMLSPLFERIEIAD